MDPPGREQSNDKKPRKRRQRQRLSRQVNAARDQSQSPREAARHSEENHYHDEPQQLEPFLDHNKNLSLDDQSELTKTNETTQTQTQTTTTTRPTSPASEVELRRQEQNDSPISSLSTRSGHTSDSHTNTTDTQCCVSNSSNSAHSTQRMSQTSLTNAAAHHQNQELARSRAVKFQDSLHGAQEQVGGGLIDLSDKHMIAITIHDNNNDGNLEDQHHHHHHHHHDHHDRSAAAGPDEFEPLRGIVNMNDPELTKQSSEHQSSLVRQLRRRVSLFPHLLARQMTWHHSSSGGGTNCASQTLNDSQQHDLMSELSDDLRRFSLPTTMSTTMSHSGEDCCDIAGGASSVGGEPEPAPVTTVAGVGGTITTVTRSKRKTAPLPRLVAKNGQVNLFIDNIDRRQYVRDLFTTMIDIKWRYNLMAAAFGFVFSWLFFACIWYIVLYVHNDLEHENDPSWSPCIVNVYSFPAALLFSIETQSTLGFGSRIISVECPGAIVIFCSQLIFGVVVECLIVGMVFAKLSRPTKRSQTIMFSKYATVCLREGKMCLTFRVGDVRSKSHIIGATLRASLVSSKLTQEGEQIPFYHHNLNVTIDDCKTSLLLIWPLTMVHVIDETSPFHKLNAEQLINFKFEIITVLEGTVESTGQSIQVRSSYLPSEVKWGYRFEPIVSTHGYGRYAQTIIDYNKFNRIIEVETPKCSPEEYYANKLLAPNGGPVVVE